MRILTSVLGLLLVSLLYSCEDIVDKDISSDLPQIVSPSNGKEIETNQVTFQWNEMKGATKYRLQVLDLNQTIVVDSTVSKTNVLLSIQQGSYQWRLRGENFAYQSPYSINFSFSVKLSNDLAKQTVVLTSPVSDLYTNNSNITLSWGELAAAQSYNVSVINTSTGEEVFQKPALTINSINLLSSNLTDGIYQWKVQAVNEESTTLFASRIFSIDTTNPNQPQNLLPADKFNSTVNTQVSYSWTTPTDSGDVQSPYTYDVEISSTNDFGTLIQRSNVATANFNYTFSIVGTYYWRVKTIDKAKNSSSYSNVNSIIVK